MASPFIWGNHEKVLKVLKGSRGNNGVLKTINQDIFRSQHYARLNDLSKKTARNVLGPSDAQGIEQAAHSKAIRAGFHGWQQHYFSWFKQLLHLSSLSALPLQLFEQPSNEPDQRADPSVKRPSRINCYFQLGPFSVPLSVQIPKQMWQHKGCSAAWTWMGSWEQFITLTVALKK